ncbi:MAG: hypothetical protein JWP84_3270, partial [Tardiphaga sp.]|nr:hypothetical protein [Tardiphaga sp.]
MRVSRRQAIEQSADSAASSFASTSGFGSSNIVAEARRYIGGNP